MEACESLSVDARPDDVCRTEEIRNEHGISTASHSRSKKRARPRSSLGCYASYDDDDTDEMPRPVTRLREYVCKCIPSGQRECVNNFFGFISNAPFGLYEREWSGRMSKDIAKAIVCLLQILGMLHEDWAGVDLSGNLGDKAAVGKRWRVLTGIEISDGL